MGTVGGLLSSIGGTGRVNSDSHPTFNEQLQ